MSSVRAIDLADMTSPASQAASGPLGNRWLRWAAVSVVVIVLAHLLDETAWRVLRKPNIYDGDFGRLLRIQGFLPTWLFGAMALWLHEVGRDSRRSHTLLLVFAPALSGGAAELLKLMFRRLRPDAETFGYAFRAFSDGPFSNRGMGLPSSHAMVAFGGAFAMARLFPRTRWVWYTLAAGCAVSRVMANAHYLSDTAVAACVAWAVVALLHARLAPKSL